MLLRRAALSIPIQQSQLTERVQRTSQVWGEGASAAYRRPLDIRDLDGLQDLLEDLADALFMHARIGNEQWCDTEPLL